MQYPILGTSYSPLLPHTKTNVSFSPWNIMNLLLI